MCSLQRDENRACMLGRQAGTKQSPKYPGTSSPGIPFRNFNCSGIRYRYKIIGKVKLLDSAIELDRFSSDFTLIELASGTGDPASWVRWVVARLDCRCQSPSPEKLGKSYQISAV